MKHWIEVPTDGGEMAEHLNVPHVISIQYQQHDAA